MPSLALPGWCHDGLELFVDGAFATRPDATIVVEDPATETALVTVADGSLEAVTVAVASAHAAFVDRWRDVEPAARGEVLARISAAIADRAEALAALESLDTGKPIGQARTDVATAARYFAFYAGVADKIHGETIPSRRGSLVYTIREPFGVDAHVIPWNSPLAQLARGVAPSLAAGNTVVVKPSELAPLSSFAAALLFFEAGLPPGVCNVVVGRGPTTGAALVEQPLVRHITFTGSVATGRDVLRRAAAAIVPVNLELGGKSPTIVLPDADLAAAVRAGVAAVVRNSGQSCFATTRMLVHRDVHDEFLDRLAAAVAACTIGPGRDDPHIGPLISAGQLARVEQFVASALAEGARVVTGGRRPAAVGRGHFYEPTVLAGVTNTMRVAREEIFGPVQCVLAFADENEAVAIANDSDFGLAAGVFTRDFATAHRLAGRLEAGQVQINRFPAGGVETPFGGYKQSGFGREKGVEALRHYTQVKTVIADIGRR